MADDFCHQSVLHRRRYNTYLHIRDELGTVFPDEDFAVLYPSRGRPAEAPWRLAPVTVFQFV